MARYLHGMASFIESYSLLGLTGNSEVARILSEHYGQDITAGDVALWRRQYPRLNAKVINALDNLEAKSVRVVANAIDDGDVATAKWLLERRNEHFKPASKLSLSGRVEGLSDMLARRMSEDQLRATGVLYDEDGNDDDYSDDDREHNPGVYRDMR